jgi:hypothetical protein
MSSPTDPCECRHSYAAHTYEKGCKVVGCECMHFKLHVQKRPSKVGKLPCKCCGEYSESLNIDFVCTTCEAKIRGIIKISQIESYDDRDAA